MRFFFNSLRYSEDMDLDIVGVGRDMLKDVVMKILQSPSFQDTLRTIGIERIVPPDMSRAKQTETTQRFKVHLITTGGEDLFTKIEFSRRGLKGKVIIESVPAIFLRRYNAAPLLVPHYEIYSVILQKIEALATRKIVQARDVFDLYMLSSQYVLDTNKGELEDRMPISLDKFQRAQDSVLAISFEQFRDTVLSYLSVSDKTTYDNPDVWDEVRLKVVNSIEGLKSKYG